MSVTYKWIEGSGGPLVLVDQAAVAAWSGASGEDYGNACAVEGLTGIVRFGGSFAPARALVIGDEPLPATFLADLGVLVQWIYASEEDALLEGVRASLPWLEGWDDSREFAISGRAVIFDAVVPGSEIQSAEMLHLNMEPGMYTVRSADLAIDSKNAARVHHFLLPARLSGGN